MARTIAQAEALAEKLRALPAIENKNRPISKAEEIKLLADEIAALQERNYSLQQIAEFLTGEGLEISTATLKNYLQRSKGSKATSKRPSKKKPAVAPKEAPSATPQATAGQSIGERAAAALPPAKSDHHQTAQAAIMRPDRERI